MIQNQNTAEIINIGDELLAGHTVNSNAAWISCELKKIGISVIRHTVIADEKNAIVSALDSIEEATDLVFLTGGLGPTEDDRTKAVITSYFGGELEFSEDIYKDVLEFFRKRGRVPTERNRDQAVFPTNAERIVNKRGTASGMIFERSGTKYFVMPGVPYEMQAMMSDTILPSLSDHTERTDTELQINTFGLPESEIADRIDKHLYDIGQRVAIGYYPSVKGITIRLNGEDINFLEKVQRKIVHLLGEAVYSINGEAMETLLVRQCREKGIVLSVAESCTGGSLSNLITDVPGSSLVFKEGYVVYSNEAKIRELKVEPDIISCHGAVSQETVEAMAWGLRNKTGADVTVGISGIAGPDGATPGKPVGLVYVAVLYGDNITVRKINFDRGRKKNKEFAARTALNLIRLAIKDIDIE